MLLGRNSGFCGVLGNDSTCEQSHCCLSTEETLSSRLLSSPEVGAQGPELWRRGFEAKANFGSAALLLT